MHLTTSMLYEYLFVAKKMSNYWKNEGVLKKKNLPWAILDISMSLREFSNFLTRMCPLISYHFWNLEALLFSPNLIFCGIFVRRQVRPELRKRCEWRHVVHDIQNVIHVIHSNWNTGLVLTFNFKMFKTPRLSFFCQSFRWMVTFNFFSFCLFYLILIKKT